MAWWHCFILILFVCLFVSGRTSAKRDSKSLKNNYELRKARKREMDAVKAMVREMRDKQRAERKEERRRREQKEKTKLENAKKSGVYQVVCALVLFQTILP